MSMTLQYLIVQVVISKVLSLHMVKITFATGLLVVLLKSSRKATPHFSTLTHGTEQSL